VRRAGVFLFKCNHNVYSPHTAVAFRSQPPQSCVHTRVESIMNDVRTQKYMCVLVRPLKPPPPNPHSPSPLVLF
jgi:hypothetical protein